MRLHLSVTVRGRTLAISYGPEQDGPAREDSQTDAYVERAHPDDVSQRAELDARHQPLGFTAP